jgi:hypothetical protein
MLCGNIDQRLGNITTSKMQRKKYHRHRHEHCQLLVGVAWNTLQAWVARVTVVASVKQFRTASIRDARSCSCKALGISRPARSRASTDSAWIACVWTKRERERERERWQSIMARIVKDWYGDITQPMVVLPLLLSTTPYHANRQAIQ